MQFHISKNIKLTPVQVVAIGFAVIIISGGILLSLPISSIDGKPTPFIDSLFTSTSAVCVTGLVTLDTGTHWNYFGKTVVLLLIELGGLGFMSFATFIALILGKKITLKERLIIQEALNSFKLQGLVKMVKYILIFTFSVQLIGAIILSTQFIPIYGWGRGIYFGVFHSVSAFCNAGFDLFGNFQSLTNFTGNSVILLTIAILIVIGGLGFTVWAEIYSFRSTKKLSVHSKIVIITTAILIVFGCILIFIFEAGNPSTIGPMNLKGKLVNSLFAAITPRTAGFNSISTSAMTAPARFLTIILMFIGGSPGSTAGGVKTTTFSIMILTVISIIRGKKDTDAFQRRIESDTIQRSFAIVTLASMLIVFVTLILLISEKGASLEYIIYEATSAFGTVGLSLGLTTKLTLIGKILISLTMYCGRLGPLSVAMALAKIDNNCKIRFPEDKVLVG